MKKCWDCGTSTKLQEGFFWKSFDFVEGEDVAQFICNKCKKGEAHLIRMDLDHEKYCRSQDEDYVENDYYDDHEKE